MTTGSSRKKQPAPWDLKSVFLQRVQAAGGFVNCHAHFDKAYHQPDPKIALTMLDLGTGAILASAMAAGTMTLAALVLIRRTRALPIWIAWLGLAVTVLALPVVPPLARLSGLVLAVWTVAISVVFVTSEAAA